MPRQANLELREQPSILRKNGAQGEQHPLPSRVLSHIPAACGARARRGDTLMAEPLSYFSGTCGPRLAMEKSQKERKPALVDMRLVGDRREGSQTKPLPSQSPAQWCSEHRRKMPQFLRTHGQLIDQSGQVTRSCWRGANPKPYILFPSLHPSGLP